MTLPNSTFHSDETWGRITNAGFVTCCYMYGYGSNYTPVKITTWRLLQDEHGAQLEPAAGADSDHFNGVSGSASSTALHHPAGPKKRRHRIPRQEKDKDQHVGGGSCRLLPSSHVNVQVCLYLVARRLVLNTNRSNSSCWRVWQRRNLDIVWFLCSVFPDWTRHFAAGRDTVWRNAQPDFFVSLTLPLTCRRRVLCMSAATTSFVLTPIIFCTFPITWAAF